MNENIWKSKWSKEQLKTILLDQYQNFWKSDTGIERMQLSEVKRAVDSPHAVVISGLRRVGKSTLLAQLAHWLGEERLYYVNFEDDRFLSFQADDADELYKT
ncbi:MAG: AAA family ATPase, partial [Anaerolineales bacterium]